MFVVVFVNQFLECYVYGPFNTGDAAREWIESMPNVEAHARAWIERVGQVK